jgi:hypothetical protein
LDLELCGALSSMPLAPSVTLLMVECTRGTLSTPCHEH